MGLAESLVFFEGIISEGSLEELLLIAQAIDPQNPSGLCSNTSPHPMLYKTSIKLLGEIFQSGVWCYQYVDHIYPYFSFPTDSCEIVSVLNQCLASVIDRMRMRKLKLNPDKPEVLLNS